MSQRTRKQSATSVATRALHRRAPIFAALGDETRLSLINELASGERSSIAQLTSVTTLTRQAVTKHLRVLEQARIVRSVKEGRENLYELDPAPLHEVRRYADEVSERWDRALMRLKRFVEED